MSDWRPSPSEPPHDQGVPPYGQPHPVQPYGGPGYGQPAYGSWPLPPPRASFWARFGAALIDGLVATFALIAVWIPLVIVGVAFSSTEPRACTSSTAGPNDVCSTPTNATIALWLVIGLVGFLAMLAVTYLILIGPVAKTGQTIGRKALGIRVVDAVNGYPISVGRALGRYLFAQFVSGFFYIGYLWMLWDDNAQTLHDKVVNSIVVPTEA